MVKETERRKCTIAYSLQQSQRDDATPRQKKRGLIVLVVLRRKEMGQWAGISSSYNTKSFFLDLRKMRKKLKLCLEMGCHLPLMRVSYYQLNWL